MAFNIYNQIPKVKEYLKNIGYTNNIPKEDFSIALMLIFGMRKKTAIEWIDNFENANLIIIDYMNNTINFKELKK